MVTDKFHYNAHPPEIGVLSNWSTNIGFFFLMHIHCFLNAFLSFEAFKLSHCPPSGFFFFCLLVAGVFLAAMPTARRGGVFTARCWPCCGSLPFTCCACRPHFIYLREKAELSALPSMLLPSSPESISAMSIPKRCSSSYDPSAVAVFPPFCVAIASHTYRRY